VVSWNTYVSVTSADEATDKVRSAGDRVIVEPFDALPAGRPAGLADPEGAAFCVWESRKRKGAQLVNDAGAWSWSGLSTRDPERANGFYNSVFGWEIETMGSGDAEYTMFRVPGYVGGRPAQPVSREVVAGMSRISGDRGDEPHWSIDFWVDDVDAIAQGRRARRQRCGCPLRQADRQTGCPSRSAGSDVLGQQGVRAGTTARRAMMSIAGEQL
jgi:predicted enzyme related to lactoylglutathione lyase